MQTIVEPASSDVKTGPTRWIGWLTGPRLAILLLCIPLAFLTVFPIIMVFWSSVRNGAPATSTGFALTGYADAFGNVQILDEIWTTIWLAIVRAILALGLAAFMAWIVARTDTPLRGMLETLVTVKFFLPQLPIIIAWMYLASPRSGLLNVPIAQVLGREQGPFNIFSYEGIIWVSVISWASFLFVMILPAFKNMDLSYEESSRMSGAGHLSTFVRVTLPLMKPALLGAGALALLRMLESFETELFLGMPARIFVLSTRVFNYLHYVPANYPAAGALSVFFLVLSFVVIALQWRMLGTREYVTVTGRGFRARPMQLGRWRYVTFTFVMAYFVVAVALPFVVVLLGSFMKAAGYFGQDPFTLKHVTYVFSNSNFWTALTNTLLVGVSSAALAVALCLAVSYVVVRTKLKGRKVIDFLAWLPYTVPTVVLGVGLFWVYLGAMPRWLYGTIWVIVFALVTRSLPVGVRTMSGVLVQISKEMEEAARIHGASAQRAFWGVLVPMVRPGILASLTLIFVLAIGDLATIVFLYNVKTQVLSALLFQFWAEGSEMEAATVVAAVLMILAVLFYVLLRLLGRRSAQVGRGDA